jgi:hypothetical protein
VDNALPDRRPFREIVPSFRENQVKTGIFLRFVQRSSRADAQPDSTVDNDPKLEESNERIAIVSNHFEGYNSPLKGFS